LKITVDTNVLVRAAVLDERAQAQLSADLLREAELIVATLPALCEFAWVLRRGYRWRAFDVLGFIRNLIAIPTVQVDRPAVEAGLAMLEVGGDFADGVIAFEGQRLGGETFVSFDSQAVALVAATGAAARLLGGPDA
jgi:predicted nucleic-acid-binding protein